MIAAEKPPLTGVYLAHFGVKGMKWGQRKRSSGDSKSRKASTAKKVAVGAAVLGGAAAAAIILSRRGKTPIIKIGKVNLKPTTMDRLREANKMKVSNFNQVKPRLGKTHYFDTERGAWTVPTPTHTPSRGGVDSVFATRMRNIGVPTNSKVDMGNLADVRRALNDPNHVWQL